MFNLELLWYIDRCLEENPNEQHCLHTLREKIYNSKVVPLKMEYDNEFPDGFSVINPEFISKEEALFLKECIGWVFKNKNEIIDYNSFIHVFGLISDFLGEDFDTIIEQWTTEIQK